MMKEIALLFEELCQKLSFFIALSLALLSQAQRNKYIELRSGNPLLRMRSDVPLGPRIIVSVKNREKSSLEQPEEWFCRLDIYQRDNPGKEVKESERTWEKINNVWVEGVT